MRLGTAESEHGIFNQADVDRMSAEQYDKYLRHSKRMAAVWGRRWTPIAFSTTAELREFLNPEREATDDPPVRR